MKIDWKHLAATDGYKSLKAAYIHDVVEAAKQRHPMRKKAEFLKLFNWVINRAKHHAHHTGKPIEEILNEWESGRNYWWLNYYGPARQGKYHSNSRKEMSVAGLKKYYKRCNYTKKHITARILQHIAAQQKASSTKTKPRWPDWRQR